MLRVFQNFSNLAIAVFRVNDSWRDFGSSYIAFALASVSEVKL
jgi:hypothetical protein